MVITHVGFGNGLYLRDAFPKARKIGFLSGTTTVPTRMWIFWGQGKERDKALRLRTWNAQTLMELADCDVGVVPTKFQYQQFPDHLTSNLVVAHEGWMLMFYPVE